VCQTAVAYPGCRRCVVFGEQLLEMAQGDVVGVRDCLGSQVGIGEVLLDECVDSGPQGGLAGLRGQ
jgi:hypothetical protein